MCIYSIDEKRSSITNHLSLKGVKSNQGLKGCDTPFPAGFSPECKCRREVLQLFHSLFFILFFILLLEKEATEKGTRNLGNTFKILFPKMTHRKRALKKHLVQAKSIE